MPPNGHASYFPSRNSESHVQFVWFNSCLRHCRASPPSRKRHIHLAIVSKTICNIFRWLDLCSECATCSTNILVKASDLSLFTRQHIFNDQPLVRRQGCGTSWTGKKMIPLSLWIHCNSVRERKESRKYAAAVDTAFARLNEKASWKRRCSSDIYSLFWTSISQRRCFFVHSANGMLAATVTKPITPADRVHTFLSPRPIQTNRELVYTK